MRANKEKSIAQLMATKRDDQAKDQATRFKKMEAGGNIYECDVCTKKFSRSGTLARHKRIHSGDKPYECDVCTKKFSQSGTLAAHKRTILGISLTNVMFAQRNFLTLLPWPNKRTHSGDNAYECDVCTQKFSQSSFLPN